MHPSASEFFHFNSRPHGGRQNRYSGIFCMHHFNSRPHGGRLAFSLILSPIAIFQLTPSRRATKSHEWRTVLRDISTHALTEGDPEQARVLRPLDISTHALTEGDIGGQGIAGILSNFNSRPHGGRHVLQILVEIRGVFQLTPSRRATAVFIFDRRTLLFQLTPSRRATIHR